MIFCKSLKTKDKGEGDLQYYFAPLEGLGNALYRRIHREHFPSMDRYYTPFYVPGAKKGLSVKARRELAVWEAGLIPQVLSDRAEDVLLTAKQLSDLGYPAINLNLGCPSGTVVAKGRGAGFLGRVEDLARFFDRVCAESPLPVSVKTRLGLQSLEEFPALLALFGRYPLDELILHPRLGVEQYGGRPHTEFFEEARQTLTYPLIYSGDLFSTAHISLFQQAHPKTHALMIGRGLLCNPGLVEEMVTGERLRLPRFLAFQEALFAAYEETLFGEAPLLHKMKELWSYQIHLFSGHEKAKKRLKKAQCKAELRAAIEAIVRDLAFEPTGGYRV